MHVQPSMPLGVEVSGFVHMGGTDQNSPSMVGIKIYADIFAYPEANTVTSALLYKVNTTMSTPGKV